MKFMYLPIMWMCSGFALSRETLICCGGANLLKTVAPW